LLQAGLHAIESGIICTKNGNDSKALFLLHGEGADASTTFTDSSQYARAFTPTGNAQIDTAQFKFGASSMLFDGSGDYLTCADSADFNLGTGDFTLDFWIRPNSPGTCRVFTFGRDETSPGGCFQIALVTSTTMRFEIRNDAGSAQASGNTTLTNGAWSHLALVRSGNTFTLYVNGVSSLTLTDSGSYSAQADGFTFGARRLASSFDQAFTGWFDEIRFSTMARWTADFTPPTKAYG